MKKLIRTSVCMVALSVLGSTATPLLASPIQDRDQQRDQQRDQDRGMQRDQDRDHDRDRGMMNDRDRGDESAYYNNKYYKQGWKDGGHHKHKDRKWKNDNDRMAYEAGYAHGDHGEQWQKHDRDHDHDHR